MRKIVLLMLAVMSIQTMFGQEWKISVGAESKALQYNKSMVTLYTGYIGYEDNSLYLLRHTDDKKVAPYLVCYDRNLVEKNKVMLPSGKDKNHYGGYVSGGSVNLLMTEKEGSSFKAYRLRYDPSTLKSLGDPEELATFNTAAGGKSYTFVNSSQSQEFLSVIFALVKDNEAEWLINLYDTQLDELWSMDFHMDVIDDYFVTDSGEVVVGGFYKKKNSDAIKVQFAILDGEREESYSDVGNWEGLQTMEIVRYHDGKIYCAGLLEGEELESNNSRWSSGFYSLVYDTKSKSVIKFDKVNFTKDDVCDLCNVNRKMKLKAASTDKVSFVNAIHDEDGTTVAFQRSFNLYVNYVPTFTAYMGLVVYRIADDGSIAWHHVVRREVQAPAELSTSVNSKLIAEGGKYNIFYIDSPKNVTPKPDAPVLATSIDKSKQILLNLSFDKRGNIGRQGIEIPSKSVCVGAPHKIGNGEYLLLLSQQFKSCIATLKY